MIASAADNYNTDWTDIEWSDTNGPTTGSTDAFVNLNYQSISGVTVWDGSQSTFYPSDPIFYSFEKTHHRWIKLEEEIKQRMPILPIMASQHYQEPEIVKRV